MKAMIIFLVFVMQSYYKISGISAELQQINATGFDN